MAEQKLISHMKLRTFANSFKLAKLDFHSASFLSFGCHWWIHSFFYTWCKIIISTNSSPAAALLCYMIAHKGSLQKINFLPRHSKRLFSSLLIGWMDMEAGRAEKRLQRLHFPQIKINEYLVCFSSRSMCLFNPPFVPPHVLL